jgi:dihydrofolate synthase/folylpolyglutamate synthase
VVGTNGKSSVTAMTVALLEAHGHRAGAYLSPHAERWAERVLISGRTIEPDAFARAVERVAAAVSEVERGFEPGERVTQFEAATAAAFVALAEAGVEYGVIEAGLGGRLDATNVIASSATALTSVGLDHTQWLGETESQIATEKLAVLRRRSVLVLGDVSPEVERLAREVAAERDARVVRPRELAPPEGRSFAAPYLRRNVAVAAALAEALLGELDPERARAALAGVSLPGRVEVVAGEPPVVLDAAHNPQGARALAEALAALARGRRMVGCLAVLADKDARGIVAELAGVLDAVVCTELAPGELAGMGRPDTKVTPAAELSALCEAAGLEASAEPDPETAIAATLRMAAEQGGVAVVCGSHYLLSHAHVALAGDGEAA